MQVLVVRGAIELQPNSLFESIPSAYTEYFGRWLMEALHVSRQKKVA